MIRWLLTCEAMGTSVEAIVKQRVCILGSYLSPYVRKVLVCLDQKGIPYEIDPIIPFYGDDRFSKLSPLRRVPVLVDDQVTLCDSTVICEYLEDRHPEPALYPRDPAARARARWLEELADTRLGEVLIWHLFHQVATRPGVWGEEADKEVVNKALTQEIPEILDYLEEQLPAEGFIFGDLSIADISLACFFRNASFARFQVDAARWPRAAGFVGRVLGLESFAKLAPFEERLLRTRVAKQRAALAEMGAPLTSESYGVATPRRGIMPI
jgi:glutathione S-transferase